MNLKDIAYAPYEFKGRAPIEGTNVHTVRPGALLRFTYSNGWIGYADCHPWKELGAKPLNEQLDLLRTHQTTPLTARSAYFARIDAEARANNVHVLDGLTVPKSHYLITNLRQMIDEVSVALDEGFTHFKIKMGRDIPHELPLLKGLLKKTAGKSIKIRIDFNMKLTKEQFETLYHEMAPWHDRIDFYEDPFRYNPVDWSALRSKGIPLAADLHAHDALQQPQTAQVVMVKPAIEEIVPFLQTTKRVVVTSCLDHPLGQTAAAYTAAQAYEQLPGKVDVCGLLSHRVYEPNLFSEMLSQSGPQYTIPEGTGFGFNELLEKQLWKTLC